MTLPLVAESASDRAVAAYAARKLSKLSVADLLATSRHDGGIVVVDELRPKVPARAADPSAEWQRSYHVRLYFVDPDCIKDAFGLSFADVATSVGKVRPVTATRDAAPHCPPFPPRTADLHDVSAIAAGHGSSPGRREAGQSEPYRGGQHTRTGRGHRCSSCSGAGCCSWWGVIRMAS